MNDPIDRDIIRIALSSRLTYYIDDEIVCANGIQMTNEIARRVRVLLEDKMLILSSSSIAGIYFVRVNMLRASRR